MIVYIAGKFSARERLLETEAALLSSGHEVVSSWLHEPESLEPANYAKIDLQDLSKADLFLIDTQDESSTGGREVEFGFALAKGIPIWRVGPERNIFHSLANHKLNSQAEAIELGKLIAFEEAASN